MPNITLKLGTLDLSQYVRVNPGERLDLGQGSMLEPAWSDSPLFEGQALTSLQVKNKELVIPLFLHPQNAPYTNDALNTLVAQINQQLRLTTDLGTQQFVAWNNAQAVNTTYFTLQFGRFEPDFNFRITEKGWLAGILHLWVLPYAHTATERVLSTWSAPTGQSGFQLTGNLLNAAGGFVPSGAATNLIPDPSFENPGASPWISDNAQATMLVAASPVLDGAQSLEFYINATSNNPGIAQPATTIPAAPSQWVTFGANLYQASWGVPTPAPFLKLTFRDSAGAILAVATSTPSALVQAQWNKLFIAGYAPDRTAFVTPDIRVACSVPTEVNYLDEMQINVATNATNMFINNDFEFVDANTPSPYWLSDNPNATYFIQSGQVLYGSQALELYCVATPNAGQVVGLSQPATQYTATPGDWYTILAYIYAGSYGVTGMGAFARMSFRDSAFNHIIAACSPATPLVIGTWNQIYVTAQAPASAAYVCADWRVGSMLPTMVTFWDAMGLMHGTTAVSPWSAASPVATVAGDLSPHFDIRMTVGSYLADDGRLGIISALPVASYTPIIPVGSFLNPLPSGVIQGASGAWASQYLAIDGGQFAVGSGGAGNFSFALSPASVYAGDNRVLGLVRARFSPYALRAFDPQGVPLGPTVIASAMDGWQLVDYGTLRLPPWMATAVINVQAYSSIDYYASGMFAPRRVPPSTWTKEHGPIFVIPNGYSVMGLDWNSPALTMDGFDGASGAALGADQLGNPWTIATWSGATITYTGSSAVNWNQVSGYVMAGGSPVYGDYEVEMVYTTTSATNYFFEILTVPSGPNATQIDARARVSMGAATGTATLTVQNSGGTVVSGAAIPSSLPGQYHLRLVSRGSLLTAYLNGPSGVVPSGAAVVATTFRPGPIDTTKNYYPAISGGAGPTGVVAEAFRARLLASQGMQARDIIHLQQPLVQHTRMTPSAVDITDLQARQRGPLQAPQLPVPSLGAGFFFASFPWDQGPANDLLNVDVRIRERFHYAR